jgi:hypothetical protein
VETVTPVAGALVESAADGAAAGVESAAPGVELAEVGVELAEVVLPPHAAANRSTAPRPAA